MVPTPALYDFLNTNAFMVLSTMSEKGQPQSALVGFGQTPQLALIFGTSMQSRKAQNILKEPRVSAVIGLAGGSTLQYEGTARMLDGTEAETYSEQFFTKSPFSRQFKDDPNERYFLITPTWIRYTDAHSQPWDVQEYRF